LQASEQRSVGLANLSSSSRDIHNFELSTGKKHDLEGLAAQQKWPWRLLDEFAAVFQAF
jgi:hypothetical protein